ncbi:MAG: hypothetical protein AcusKO_02760 [Acuticoccus sp.]
MRLLPKTLLQRLPDLDLALVTRIDCEGHQLVKHHFLVRVRREQRRRDRRKLQALLHDIWRDEEGRGDLLDRLSLFAQCLEGTELIQRMERRR